MAQTIQDVMSTDTITISPSASLVEAARLMRDQSIGDVLVEEPGGRLRGIVTDRDITIRAVAEGEDPNRCQVQDICSGDVVTVPADAPIDRAVSLMREHAVRRLPVVNNGKAVGFVSLGDLAIEQQPQSALSDISAAPSNS